MTQYVPERNSRRRQKPKTTPETLSSEFEGAELIDLAEWIRLPAPGERCPRTGLSRSSYNDLIFADPPKIQSIVVKKPGASRGVRLLLWSSVRKFLHGLVEAHESAKEIDGEGRPL